LAPAPTLRWKSIAGRSDEALDESLGLSSHAGAAHRHIGPIRDFNALNGQGAGAEPRGLCASGLPFERLVEVLNTKALAVAHPLFQVMLASETEGLEKPGERSSFKA